MNAWQRAWREAGKGGVACVVLVLLALVVCAPFAWRFARAWFMPAPSAFAAKDDTKERAQQYAAAFEPYVKQLDGRSLFYEPSAPGSEGEVAVEPEEEIDPSQPAPTRYDGPAIQAVVLDSVWFADGQRVKAGAGKVGDMEVVSTNAPWDVKVRWRGTEFTVPFFERDKVIFKAAKGAGGAGGSGADDASPPAAAATTEPVPEAPAASPPADQPATQPADKPGESAVPPPSPAPTDSTPPAPSETPR